jgi:hypothetical protein
VATRYWILIQTCAASFHLSKHPDSYTSHITLLFVNSCCESTSAVTDPQCSKNSVLTPKPTRCSIVYRLHLIEKIHRWRTEEFTFTGVRFPAGPPHPDKLRSYPIFLSNENGGKAFVARIWQSTSADCWRYELVDLYLHCTCMPRSWVLRRHCSFFIFNLWMKTEKGWSYSCV